MTDVQHMGGTVDDPQLQGEMTVLTGRGPVSELQNYWQEVAVYTRGMGRLSCTLRGYELCHNAEEVIAAIGYEAERDTENPADSVFCSHGAGVTVKWDEAPQHMHVSPELPAEEAEEMPEQPVRRSYTAAGDKELQAIFERTYGKVERRDFRCLAPPHSR